MKTRFLVILSVWFWCAGAGAAVRSDKAGRAEAEALVKQIQQEIAAADAAAIEKVVADYDKLLEDDSPQAANLLRDRWIKELMDKRFHRQVEVMCLKAILAEPADTALVEALQQARITANLAAQNPRRALEQAKGLYNVSSLATTSSAMLVVAECLSAAYPDKPEIVQQFELQQVAGATAPATTQPTTPPTTRATTAAATTRAGDSVLAGIQVDDAEYRQTIAHSNSEDFTSLMGRGNLLLLADRPAPARSLFERAYAQASNAQLPAASEALARQMKAQDGTIGRANAWVESIRPVRGGKKP